MTRPTVKTLSMSQTYIHHPSHVQDKAQSTAPPIQISYLLPEEEGKGTNHPESEGDDEHKGLLDNSEQQSSWRT